MLRIFTIYLKNILIIVFCHHISIIQANRIVGGKPTTIDKAKYMVSLRDSHGVFFCGGSLVKYQYVVTAAHCVDDRKVDDIFVHAGVTYLQQRGIRRAVIKKRMPKRFSREPYYMDIAVLKLNTPIMAGNTTRIPLCTRYVPVNSLVNIYGWGKRNESAVWPSNQLRTTFVKVIAQKKCRAQYDVKHINITKTMLCATGGDMRDSCSGDSGGPLIYRGQLCGVVSFGIGCAHKKFPGVYTNVNAAKSFLQQALIN